MNYKCITNEPSRGLRTAKPAQSITALTRQWAACLLLSKRKNRRQIRHPEESRSLKHMTVCIKEILQAVVSLWLCEVIT